MDVITSFISFSSFSKVSSCWSSKYQCRITFVPRLWKIKNIVNKYPPITILLSLLYMIRKPIKYITKELIQKEIELINEQVAELDLSSKPIDPLKIKVFTSFPFPASLTTRDVIIRLFKI